MWKDDMTKINLSFLELDLFIFIIHLCHQDEFEWLSNGIFQMCFLLVPQGFLFAIRNHSEMLPAKVQKGRVLLCHSCVLQEDPDCSFGLPGSSFPSFSHYLIIFSFKPWGFEDSCPCPCGKSFIPSLVPLLAQFLSFAVVALLF